MKFSIKDFFSKCDKIHSFLQIWSHLLRKSLTENVIYFAQWSSTDICSIALTLLLVIVFLFITLINTIYYSKEIGQFKY